MESLPLPIADIIVIIMLLTGAFTGFRKGVVVSIASCVAIIAGAMAAYFFSDCLGLWLSEYLNWSEGQIAVASFALTFILVVLGVHLLAKMLEGFLNLVALGMANKVAGGVFGILKNALIISFIAYGLSGFDGLLPDDFGEDCIVYPHVESLAPAVLPYWEELKEKSTLEEIEEVVEEKVEEAEKKVGGKLKEKMKNLGSKRDK